MSSIVVGTKVIGPKTFKIVGWSPASIGGTVGCQASVVSCIGQFAVNGISMLEGDQKVVVGLDPAIYMAGSLGGLSISHNPNLFSGVPKGLAPLTDQMVVDALYEALLPWHKGKGAVVFSDRINRGAKASPSLRAIFGKANCTTATFAKWLSDHPEHGPIFSSPIFHNPNHTGPKDFSLCQVWTWFPKDREKKFFVDEAISIGIGPDTNKYPKKDVDKGYAELWPEQAKEDGPLKITYDDVPTSGVAL